MKPVKTNKKYHNIITEYNGIRFDSRKEANRYKQLLLLKQAGIITDIIRQPVFLLHEGFKNKWTGKKEQSITYRADFAVKYKDMDHWTVEDVKGGDATKTTDFKMKRKMFLKRYPCLELLII